MKVKLLERYAGPRGNFAAGTEIDVSDVEGAALCGGGYATRVKHPVAKEAAVLPPAPEVAADVETPGQNAKAVRKSRKG